MAKKLYEADVLLAVAKAQGIVAKAAVQILARDKTDGIRAVRWLEAHDEVYRKIAAECRGGVLGDDVIERADQLSGKRYLDEQKIGIIPLKQPSLLRSLSNERICAHPYEREEKSGVFTAHQPSRERIGVTACSTRHFSACFQLAKSSHGLSSWLASSEGSSAL